MEINYLKESLTNEKCSGELANIMNTLRQKRTKAQEQARANGEDAPEFYDMILDELKSVKKTFDDRANIFWRMHKRANTELDEDGINNLLAAMIKSWAEDFEDALSHGRTNKIEWLRKEGENLVKDRTVKRIEDMHREFVKVAHGKFGEIYNDSLNAPKFHNQTDHSGAHMRNRCPLCNGGMYTKRVGKTLYLVKCSRCYLSEIVEVVS